MLLKSTQSASAVIAYPRRRVLPYRAAASSKFGKAHMRGERTMISELKEVTPAELSSVDGGLTASWTFKGNYDGIALGAAIGAGVFGFTGVGGFIGGLIGGAIGGLLDWIF
jgi:hypothetical protein